MMMMDLQVIRILYKIPKFLLCFSEMGKCPTLLCEFGSAMARFVLVDHHLFN